MTDGGAESGRVKGLDKGTSGSSSSGKGNFARAIAQISVAQICESEGYQVFRQSALEALADIAIRYIQELGRSAHFHANSSGRTESNVFDVIQALEELSSPVGFTGASDINSFLSGSGVIREITQYTSLAEEVPFARRLPCFPIVRDCRPVPSFCRLGETPPGTHIPPWLPAFPDPHTYKVTPVWTERSTDLRVDRIEQARQPQKTERSLVNLQQRLMCNGVASSTLNSWDGDVGDAGKLHDKRQIENPFLAPPLLFGEKEVSHVPLPPRLSGKPHVEGQMNLPSVVEAFGPVIESAKNGFGVSVSEERQHVAMKERILPNKRPAVNFKLVSHRNVSGSSLELGVGNLQKSEKNPVLFSTDGEKDDKKRRAEQILNEAMENPQELAQL